MKKERDSNIELLRIIATLFIVIVHCNGWFLMEWGGVTNWSSGGYENGLLVGGVRATIQSITCLGVDVFILISGFYGIRPKIKSILNMVTLLLFFYILCYLLGCIVETKSFSWQQFFGNFRVFSKGNWFIDCYIVLMLLSPAINSFFENSDNRTINVFVICFSLFTFYFGCVNPLDDIYYFNGGYSALLMMYIYSIGRFLHNKENRLKDLNIWLIILAWCISIVAMVLFRFLSSDEKQYLNYCSPFVVVSSVLLFLFFYKLPKFHNRIVNWVAVSCLSVFIFHTRWPIIDWLANKDVLYFTTEPFYMYIIKMSGIIGGIFIISILLDKVRLFIFSPIINCKLWDRKKEKL